MPKRPASSKRRGDDMEWMIIPMKPSIKENVKKYLRTMEFGVECREQFDKYITLDNVGLQHRFIEMIVWNYKTIAQSHNMDKEERQKCLDHCLNLAMLILNIHSLEYVVNGQKIIHLMDIADKSVAEGWRDLIQIIAYDFQTRKPEDKKIRNDYVFLYNHINAQSKHLPDAKYPHVSIEEFINYMKTH